MICKMKTSRLIVIISRPNAQTLESPSQKPATEESIHQNLKADWKKVWKNTFKTTGKRRQFAS